MRVPGAFMHKSLETFLLQLVRNEVRIIGSFINNAQCSPRLDTNHTFMYKNLFSSFRLSCIILLGDNSHNNRHNPHVVIMTLGLL